MKRNTLRIIVAVGASLVSGMAAAHTGTHDTYGFISGLAHPLTGLDHLAVILAVGLWLGICAPRQATLLMSVFLTCMAAGAVLGAAGVVLPGVETGIAASLLIAGLLMTTRARLPLTASAALVAVFAVFNGAAHGAEMPASATPLLFGLGMLMATGALQLAAIRLVQRLRHDHADWLLRSAGIAGSGLAAWLLLGA